MSKWRAPFELLLKYLPPIAAASTLASIVYLAVVGDPPEAALRAIIWLGVFVSALLVAVFATSFFLITAQNRAGAAAEQLAVAKAELARDGGRFVRVLTQLNELLEIDYHYCTYLSGPGRQANAGFIKKEFERYLDDLLSHTATIFRYYTGSDCSASIKQLHISAEVDPTIECAPCNGDRFEYIYTLHRDPVSKVARRKADRKGTALYIYPYAHNTAFKEMLGSPDNFKSFFTMDELDSRGTDYENSNPEWRKYYNAVAVAALSEPGGDGPIPHTLGFLCVDNLSGGFDDQACRQLLECVASIAYYSIQGTNDVLNEERERTDD